MSKIGDYSVLLLTIPPSPAYPKPANHTIYLRPHAPKIPTESDSRSLFLVNVPIDSTEAHIRAVFTSLVGAGRVEDVTFEHERKPVEVSKEIALVSANGNKKRKRGVEEVEAVDDGLPQTWDRELRRSGSTAVVVLVDGKSVEGALKAVRKAHKSGKWPTWGAGTENKVEKLGSERYAIHHALRYPDQAALQGSVDAFMEGFNRREEGRQRDEKRARGVPDEDGFVMVGRGGRTGPARREEAEEKKREMDEREKEKREGRGDFYRFQMREKRKEEAGMLVKRFEEDRKRVEGMRAKRGTFRPEK